MHLQATFFGPRGKRSSGSETTQKVGEFEVQAEMDLKIITLKIIKETKL